MRPERPAHRRRALVLGALLAAAALVALLWPTSRTSLLETAAPVAVATSAVPRTASATADLPAVAASGPPSPPASAASAASADTVPAVLAALHAADRAHCQRATASWAAIQALAGSARPPSSLASLPDGLRREVESVDRRLQDAAARSLALRLAQLDARTDDFSRGIALWLRGQGASLPALALRSPDARLVRLALRHGCPEGAEACRQPLRAQWLRLEPDNAAAWLAQWEAFDAPAGATPPAEVERRKDALLAGMAAATRHDDGEAEVAAWVLSAPGPARSGLHAAAEESDWTIRMGSQAFLIRSWRALIAHCKPPSSPPGSAHAQACLAALEPIWREPPATLIQAMLSTAIARNLGQGGPDGQPPWPAREQQRDALWGMTHRTVVPMMEHVRAGYACQFDEAATRYVRRRLVEGQGPALRAEMQRLGLDEAQLAAEHRATRPRAASAAR